MLPSGSRSSNRTLIPVAAAAPVFVTCAVMVVAPPGAKLTGFAVMLPTLKATTAPPCWMFSVVALLFHR
jgi:hypothetical protein